MMSRCLRETVLTDRDTPRSISHYVDPGNTGPYTHSHPHEHDTCRSGSTDTHNSGSDSHGAYDRSFDKTYCLLLDC